MYRGTRDLNNAVHVLAGSSLSGTQSGISGERNR